MPSDKKSYFKTTAVIRHKAEAQNGITKFCLMYQVGIQDDWYNTHRSNIQWTDFRYDLFVFIGVFFFNQIFFLQHEIVDNIDVSTGSNIYLHILRHHWTS